MSIDVERLFSHGCILLSHTRNRLSAERTCALLCVGQWSKLGWVQESDIEPVEVIQVDSDSE